MTTLYPDETYPIDFGNRGAQGKVDDLFYRRWSPRSFTGEKIAAGNLRILFNAARFAPSCNNEQPWIFLTSSGPEDFKRFLDLLTEPNQRWARTASLLGFIIARREFMGNGNKNSWAGFDCGAAWMSLSLQARRMGLYTHGMAGIKKKEIYESFSIPRSRFRVISGFALGVLADPAALPEDLQSREYPSPRKPLEKIWFRGNFPEKEPDPGFSPPSS